MKVGRQSGFTLVEIAIVLVVIGLLLGGILKGQQLINSARVRNMADQNSGVQAAYYGFIDRFRQVPGDMPAQRACQAITSNITDCGASPYANAEIGGDQNGRVDTWKEAGALWAHLAHAQFLNGAYTGATTTAAKYEEGVLTGAVPGNAFQQPILLGCTNDYDNSGKQPTVRLAYVFGGGVTPMLLRELDVKLDDGDPGSGIVRATLATPKSGEKTIASQSDDFGQSNAVKWFTAQGPACVTGANTMDAVWNVDSDNTSCNAMFLY